MKQQCSDAAIDLARFVRGMWHDSDKNDPELYHLYKLACRILEIEPDRFYGGEECP